MLIEDDVYSESLCYEKPLPAKYWDRDDMTLHCSSFQMSGPRIPHRLGGGG
jgi:DNA-binding transcriptional MocR family regulator